jgi:serine-type D-Ala-D-Ala carboxypeptidase (penicillin-binding protein 5/6)
MLRTNRKAGSDQRASFCATGIGSGNMLITNKIVMLSGIAASATAGLLFTWLGATGATAQQPAAQPKSAAQQPAPQAKSTAQAAQTQPGQQSDFIIKARQAVLIDADSGAVLYQHNADQLAPPASMSKLMTLAVAFRALKQGTIRPEDEFLMSEYAWRTGGGPSGTSAMFVPINTRVRVEELIKGVIIQSGNDAAIALAEGIAGSEQAFAKQMTDEARRLGLKKSTFMNATGLFHAEHLMTARELALVARHLIREYPEYYAIFQVKEFPYRKHKFINRNPLLFLNIGADGLKTGFIKEAGYGIVASAKQGERRLIGVVNGAATQEERRDESRRMLEWGFRAFGEFKIFDPGEIVGRARVWGGDRMSLPLMGNGAVVAVLPRFPANQKLRAEIVYQGPLKAPITKGDQVARLRVISSTDATSEIPLYAAEDVKPAGKWKRGFDTLYHMTTKWLP